MKPLSRSYSNVSEFLFRSPQTLRRGCKFPPPHGAPRVLKLYSLKAASFQLPLASISFVNSAWRLILRTAYEPPLVTLKDFRVTCKRKIDIETEKVRRRYVRKCGRTQNANDCRKKNCFASRFVVVVARAAGTTVVFDVAGLEICIEHAT